MKPEIIGQLFTLALSLLVSAIAWRHFSRRRYPAAVRYDTFAPRFWVGWVDSGVLWPINVAGLLLLTADTPRPLAAAVVAVQSLAWLVYTIGLHARYGQTVGKIVCRVRVVDHRTEQAIGLRQACLREAVPLAFSVVVVGYEVARILDGTLSAAGLARGDLANHHALWALAILPLLWFVAEVATMLTNPKRRALHDYIAGTVVVRTNVE